MRAHPMHRRSFLSLLGTSAAATAWPLAAGAQRASMPVIGFLGNASAESNRLELAAFHQGLRENGYVEGRNVRIEHRWAEGRVDRLPAMAAELVRLPVAIILADANAGALAAKAATTAIPIVFAIGG